MQLLPPARNGPAEGPVPAAELILQHLSAAEWDALAGFVETRHHHAGEVIVSAGETRRTLYFVRTGTVRAPDAADAMVPRFLRPGAVFGELAFFDGEPLPLTLCAHSDVGLWALGHPAFERLAAWYPRIARHLLLDLGRVLCGRLRRAGAWS